MLGAEGILSLTTARGTGALGRRAAGAVGDAGSLVIREAHRTVHSWRVSPATGCSWARGAQGHSLVSSRTSPEGWSLGRWETEISFLDQVPFPGRGVYFLVPPTLHSPAGTRKGLCAHRFTCLRCPGHQCSWAGLPASRRLTPGRGHCGGAVLSHRHRLPGSSLSLGD